MITTHPISLMSFSGVRPEVLGNHHGNDNLMAPYTRGIKIHNGDVFLARTAAGGGNAHPEQGGPPVQWFQEDQSIPIHSYLDTKPLCHPYFDAVVICPLARPI